MNKDVIYIEPEDDITDIITRIEGAKERIVALVPPKKAGVFRSLVNIKLIAKAGVGAEKTVVLVTSDPSIVKLAGAAKLPVTKNLQSAPEVPEGAEVAMEVDEKTEIASEGPSVDASEFMVENEKTAGEDEKGVIEASERSEEVEDKDKGDEEEAKEEKSEKKAKKRGGKFAGSKNPVLKWVGMHPKIAIGGGASAVILLVVAIWAFAIAPAVTITLSLRTLTGNFSENVTFTQVLTEENVEAGKFYLTEKKLETKTEVEFTATGTKNVGEKASGSVVVYAYFDEAGNIAIPAGTEFSISGLKFVATGAGSLVYDGENLDVCDNKGNASSLLKSGCQISARVNVEAAASGAQYNVAASNTGWSTTAAVGVYSDKAMSGGTDKTVTVVQQADIDKALSEMGTSSESLNKQKLFESIEDEDAFIIETSFAQTTGAAVSSPAVGEEVEEGKKAKLSVVTTDSVFTIDETKVKEFITEKAKLAENYKIYEMNDPFVENFSKGEAGYAGKLKTSYVSGPKMTENDVIEVVKGKGLGTAQHDLNDAYGEGIRTVTIDTSVPWVMSVPGNPEKITVVIKTEENN